MRSRTAHQSTYTPQDSTHSRGSAALLTAVHRTIEEPLQEALVHAELARSARANHRPQLLGVPRKDDASVLRRKRFDGSKDLRFGGLSRLIDEDVGPVPLWDTGVVRKGGVYASGDDNSELGELVEGRYGVDVSISERIGHKFRGDCARIAESSVATEHFIRWERKQEQRHDVGGGVARCAHQHFGTRAVVEYLEYGFDDSDSLPGTGPIQTGPNKIWILVERKIETHGPKIMNGAEPGLTCKID